jgi:hypothetical protein
MALGGMAETALGRVAVTTFGCMAVTAGHQNSRVGDGPAAGVRLASMATGASHRCTSRPARGAISSAGVRATAQGTRCCDRGDAPTPGAASAGSGGGPGNSSSVVAGDSTSAAWGGVGPGRSGGWASAAGAGGVCRAGGAGGSTTPARRRNTAVTIRPAGVLIARPAGVLIARPAGAPAFGFSTAGAGPRVSSTSLDLACGGAGGGSRAGGASGGIASKLSEATRAGGSTAPVRVGGRRCNMARWGAIRCHQKRSGSLHSKSRLVRVAGNNCTCGADGVSGGPSLRRPSGPSGPNGPNGPNGPSGPSGPIPPRAAAPGLSRSRTLADSCRRRASCASRRCSAADGPGWVSGAADGSGWTLGTADRSGWASGAADGPGWASGAADGWSVWSSINDPASQVGSSPLWASSSASTAMALSPALNDGPDHLTG